MRTIFVASALSLACMLTSTAAAAGPRAVHDQWEKSQFRFTPDVETAFLDEAKAAALKKLSAAGKALPADFLAWIESDSIVKTTVYGVRQDPSGILLTLRSLELDLGQEVVRKKYTQLALAMAVVHAKDGDNADISPRKPLVLRINGDPRKLVDTHDKNRPLDLDDHIINFLNDHAPIVEDVVVGYKEILPELKYDSKGKSIPQRAMKPKKEAVKEKRPRPLRAADVIADAALEREFNQYMKAHGQSVQLHCGGESRLNWHSHDARGIDGRGVKEAYELFTHAYKAKGYLPPQRDPVPTPAQRCAFLIRNDEYKMAADKKPAWPKFPLTAPWPVLAMLAHDAQPLRERQDIWERYRDKGEFHGYGEYVGPIAQASLYLQARRLAPFAFSYGSVQMMLKDGGVCGTMANISVRSHLSLGVPASTAGQPGHCALVMFAYNDKDKTYRCHGGQYATAGDAGTGVHVPWLFGGVDARRPMVYHQSIAWSVNCGFQAYLDSTVAHTFFMQLPAADREAHGAAFLQSALALCPYNFLLVDDILDGGTQPGQLVAFWKNLKPALDSGKPGCPTDGLYNTTIKNKLFARLTALPAPADATESVAMLSFLQGEGCTNQTALAAYKIAVKGLPALLAETGTALKNHLVSARTDATCLAMAETLSATAARIADKKQRIEWAIGCWQEIQGKEKYLARVGRHGGKTVILADKCVATLAKLAGKKPRPENDQIQSVLDSITEQLKAHIASSRSPQTCKQLSATIAATASCLNNVPEQKRQWIETLAKAMSGKEQYQFQVKGRTQTLRDVCSTTIEGLATPSQPQPAR